MALENQITVIGNLTKDPEIRYTNDGTAVCSLAVAVNRRVRNAETGQWEDQLDGFFDGTVWRDHATNVAASLRKGDRVIMIGRLVKRTYQDKDGMQRTAIDVMVDEVAPSLRWATASVTRASNDRNSGGYNPAYQGQPAQAAPMQNQPMQGQPMQAPPAVSAPTDSVPF